MAYRFKIVCRIAFIMCLHCPTVCVTKQKSELCEHRESSFELFSNFIISVNKHIYSHSLNLISFNVGARGSVLGWSTILQAGRSCVRVPLKSLDFFNWPNLSSRPMALGSVEPLTEKSTRNLPRGKGLPGRQTDNIPAVCGTIVFKIWDLRRLTTPWDFTACYKDSFTSTPPPPDTQRCSKWWHKWFADLVRAVEDCGLSLW
jgi:hypothetical protein